MAPGAAISGGGPGGGAGSPIFSMGRDGSGGGVAETGPDPLMGNISTGVPFGDWGAIGVSGCATSARGWAFNDSTGGLKAGSNGTWDNALSTALRALSTGEFIGVTGVTESGGWTTCPCGGARGGCWDKFLASGERPSSSLSGSIGTISYGEVQSGCPVSGNGIPGPVG
jgi:hypothetical protein